MSAVPGTPDCRPAAARYLNHEDGVDLVRGTVNVTEASLTRGACRLLGRGVAAAYLDLPGPDATADDVARRAMAHRPPGSLGRLEDIVAWLARWGRVPLRLDRVDVLVFAGNHGVTAHGVSAYPAEVTVQMVANFASGGAAINQLALANGCNLRVVPLSLDQPTADFTHEPAMDTPAFLAAVNTGYNAVSSKAALVCLGEMGIGNTTAAAAIAAALYGGGAARWAGRGTGVDDQGLARKRAVIDAAVARHASRRVDDPLAVAAASRRARTGRDPRRGATALLVAFPVDRRKHRLDRGSPLYREEISSTRLDQRARRARLGGGRASPCCSTGEAQAADLGVGSAKARAPRDRGVAHSRNSPATTAWRCPGSRVASKPRARDGVKNVHDAAAPCRCRRPCGLRVDEVGEQLVVGFGDDQAWWNSWPRMVSPAAPIGHAAKSFASR